MRAQFRKKFTGGFRGCQIAQEIHRLKDAPGICRETGCEATPFPGNATCRNPPSRKHNGVFAGGNAAVMSPADFHIRRGIPGCAHGGTPCPPRNFPHFAGDFPNSHPASWARVGKWPFSPILLNAPQYPNSTNRLETPRVNKGSPMRAAWKFLRRKHVRWPLVAARYPHRFYRGNRVALWK